MSFGAHRLSARPPRTNAHGRAGCLVEGPRSRRMRGTPAQRKGCRPPRPKPGTCFPTFPELLQSSLTSSLQGGANVVRPGLDPGLCDLPSKPPECGRGRASGPKSRRWAKLNNSGQTWTNTSMNIVPDTAKQLWLDLGQIWAEVGQTWLDSQIRPSLARIAQTWHAVVQNRPKLAQNRPNLAWNRPQTWLGIGQIRWRNLAPDFGQTWAAWGGGGTLIEQRSVDDVDHRRGWVSRRAAQGL